MKLPEKWQKVVEQNSEYIVQSVLGENEKKKKKRERLSLVVQWLRLQASNAGVWGSILGQGTKIPLARQRAPPQKKTLYTLVN